MRTPLYPLNKLVKSYLTSQLTDSEYIRQKIIKRLTRFEPSSYLESHRKQQLLNKLNKSLNHENN